MKFTALEAYLDSLVEQGVPGVDCKVCCGGREVFRHMAGYADATKQRPVRGDELYWIYSASKVFTCTAALQLLEQGKIHLDDPVSKFLPEYAQMRVVDSAGNITEAKNPITIWNLFTMTGGLSYDLESPALKRQAATGKTDTRSMIRALSEEPLQFEPGTHYLYSLCHDVLAVVVEEVSGMRFGEYMKKYFFEPLGMPDTYYAIPEDKAERMAAQYRYTPEGKFIPVDLSNKYVWPNYESGGAGMVTSVDDYMKFSKAMANKGLTEDGYRLLKPETIDLMRTNQLSGVLLKDYRFQLGRPGYGYGLGVRTLIDKSFGSRSPLGEFGWDGAAGSYTLIDVENNVAVYYAQHVLEHQPVYDVIHPTLRDTVYQCLEA